jgi:prepilin-type N-terminal cleavage/methylation domain-containing protein
LTVGRRKGFTLVELLVAMAVFAVLIIATLQLFDSSSRISRVQSELADVQENVRFAAYHVLRLARMAGIATAATEIGSNPPRGLPSYVDQGGTLVPLAAHVLNNVSSFTDGLGTSRNTMAGQDVLLLRGHFEADPLFANLASGAVVGSFAVPATTATGLVQPLVVPAANQGVLFMGQDLYAVGTVTGAASDGTTLTVNFSNAAGGGASTAWFNCNPRDAGAGSPVFNLPPRVSRVAFLETYMFFVTDDNVLRRWRMSSNSVEPVAVGVAGLQVALGLDTDLDGAIDNWLFDTAGETVPGNDVLAASRILGLRVTVLGRTDAEIPEWNEPAGTFTVEDMTAPTGAERSAKWRALQVVATLRNYAI